MYNKILVINLMHVGDLLLVTPVLRTLRTNYPKAHIALLADQKLADLVRLNPCINELIPIDKKGYHNKLSTYFSFLRDLRKKEFDLVINLHANERASFLAAFSGANKIMGYSSWGLGVFFDFVMKNRKEVKHQVESHFDVLREGIGLTQIDDRGLEMVLDESSEEKAAKLWQTAFPDQQVPVIAFNIGASWPTKRWPKESFAELADKLLEKGYGIVFLGGTMDEEIVGETIRLMRHKDHSNVAVLTGKMSLMELGAVLKKCRALVTNDSGPMHVAVAMNVPLVSMFGASPVTGFSPYNDISVVLKSPVDCHPCYSHTCDRGLECMYAITVEEVLDETLKMAEENAF